MVREKLSLRWDQPSFQEVTLQEGYQQLRDTSEMFDVTLSCLLEDGKTAAIPTHKTLLSSFSPIFKDMITQGVRNSYSILYMYGISYKHLANIVDFMYYGEVNVDQSRIHEFLEIAGNLQIKGLKTQTNSFEEQKSYPQKLQPRSLKKTLEEKPKNNTKDEKISYKKIANELQKIENEKTVAQDVIQDVSSLDLGSIKHEIFGNDDWKPEKKKLTRPIKYEIKDPEHEFGESGPLEDYVELLAKTMGHGKSRRRFVICKLCDKEMRSDGAKTHIQKWHNVEITDSTINWKEIDANRKDGHREEREDSLLSEDARENILLEEVEMELNES